MRNFSPAKTAYLLFLLLTCIGLLAAQASAQNQKPDQKAVDVERIETALVQTDVTVLDKKRRFVKGLKSDQFRLQVNQKPREILFFEPVVAGSVNEDARMAAARGRASTRPAATTRRRRTRAARFPSSPRPGSGRSSRACTGRAFSG